MKKLLLTLIVVLAYFSSAFAQDWVGVNPNNYESHWPTFNYHVYILQEPLVAAITIDGQVVSLDTENWSDLEVAAFVTTDDGQEECRSNHMWLTDEYVIKFVDPFLTIDGFPIYYNTPGGTVYFKMYDHANNIEYTECTVTYLGEPHVILTGEENVQGWYDPENPIILNFTTTEPQYESHWPDFDYTAFFSQVPLVAAIEIDGEIVTAGNHPDNWNALEIAFFVGEECRGAGVANYLTNEYVENYGDPFPIIDGAPVYYNNAGEVVTVKMYDHVNGIEYNQCTVTLLGEAYEIYTGDDNVQGWDDPENPIILDFTPQGCPRPGEVTVSDITTSGATVSWTENGTATAWQICLNNDETSLVDINEPYYSITGLAGEQYTVKVRAICNSGVSAWSAVKTFSLAVPCPAPTLLNVTEITDHSALLTWTENGSATAWQICLNNDETSLVDINEPYYSITGLNVKTQYTVKVRAICDSGVSAWSAVKTFTTAQYESHWPDFYYPHFLSQTPCVAAIVIDGEIVTADNYPDNWYALEIAFFVGDECRGAGAGVAFGSYDPAWNYLYNGYVEEYGDPFPIINGAPIYYVNAGELVTVKMYDHVNGIEYNECTVTYMGDLYEIRTGAYNDQGWGDPENPIILHFTTCLKPTELTASNVGFTSVDLNWTENGTATEWQISLNGDTNNLVTSNSNPFTLTGLTPQTYYTAKVRENCGDSYSGWSNTVTFTTICPVTTIDKVVCAAELPIIWNGLEIFEEGGYTVILTSASGCDSTVTMNLSTKHSILPYFEDFESYTESTTAATGIEPTCWELVQEDVAMMDVNRPQLYYMSDFAHSGNYSLKLYNRGVYAMPPLSNGISMHKVKLEMYLRQPYAAYQLEVGVWDEETESFEPVHRFNNSGTAVEYVTCNFSSYTGSGRRIAFRNVLSNGTNYVYSYNYIDDILLTETEGCALSLELHDSNGDGWNGNKILIHNYGTTQEVTLDSGSDSTVTIPVYEGPLSFEWVNGHNTEDCSFIITGSSCLHYEGSSMFPGVFHSMEMNCENGILPIPEFTYWTENTCNSVIVHFENNSSYVENVSWDFGDGTTSREFAPTHEYNADGTYHVTLSVNNGFCEYDVSTTDNLTMIMPDPIVITLPYFEDFENHTISTTAETGVEPTCWELVQEDVAMTDANRPQLYYRSDFAHSGSYSLQFGNRGVYAMPELDENISVREVKLEMYLRQPKTYDALQVGVWENNGTFVPVATFNNSTTGIEFVECNFSTYSGNGHRIAFRNISGDDVVRNTSYNYIDDIILTKMERGCDLFIELRDNYGDGWTGNKILIHNYDTIQEVTLDSGSEETFIVPVYEGPLSFEWVNGQNTEECSFTITGPSCLHYSGEAPSQGVFYSMEMSCENGIPSVPEFTYWTENTCNSVIVHFENNSINAENTLWYFGDGTGSVEVAPTHEYTADGTYLVTLSVNNGFCEYDVSTTDNLTMIMPDPIVTLPYFEDFENHTISTTTETGVEPDCWEVFPIAGVTLTNATKPQLYRGYATSGAYTLRLKNRCVYAMPELDGNVNVSGLTMTFRLRQPNKIYRLQVGVLDAQGNFTTVKTLNNSSTGTEDVTVDFSNYTGNGHQIAFRNTLTSGSTLEYSINYLDNIVLDYTPVPCGISELPYTENFDDYTQSTTTETGEEPDCWEVFPIAGITLTESTKPQVYRGYASSGSYSLRMKNRCVLAMPELDENINISDLTLTMKLRQPKTIYRLQVGVVDGQGTFKLVKTLNNTSTSTEDVTVSFANYTGHGRRIAFRNTLVSGSTLDYSINYIDDINLSRTTNKSMEVTDADAGMLDADRDMVDVIVYPNPTRDVVNVQCTMNNAQCSGIEIVDVYGKIITTVGTRFIASAQFPASAPTQINVSGLAAGMYFVRVTTDKGVVTKPFVKR